MNQKTVSMKSVAMKVSRISILVNVILSLLKLIAGIVARSGAMVSDAVHSASDVFSTIIVMIGIRISSKESDKEHPYGHERMECVAAIVLAVILFLTGLMIGYQGLIKIISGKYGELGIPGALALWAAVISIVVKEWMYWYTRINAKKINSAALMADAWHHRSDALSSIGSFVGILAARLGFPVMDPIASVIICIFILKAAIDIFKDAISKMVDQSCDEETENRLRKIILSEPGVLAVDLLRTRMFGNKIYVDVEIAAEGSRTLTETHSIAAKVHEKIENEFQDVKHIMVHVNPYEEKHE